MDMITASVLVLFGIGLTAAVILAVASKVLYVYEDPRIAQVESRVGRCQLWRLRLSGLRRCAAQGVVEGKAGANVCVIGGDSKSPSTWPPSWDSNFLPWKNRSPLWTARAAFGPRTSINTKERQGLPGPTPALQRFQDVPRGMSRLRHLCHGLPVRSHRDGPQRLSRWWTLNLCTACGRLRTGLPARRDHRMGHDRPHHPPQPGPPTVWPRAASAAPARSTFPAISNRSRAVTTLVPWRPSVNASPCPCPSAVSVLTPVRESAAEGPCG